jgi:hypothetical protein
MNRSIFRNASLLIGFIVNIALVIYVYFVVESGSATLKPDLNWLTILNELPQTVVTIIVAVLLPYIMIWVKVYRRDASVDYETEHARLPYSNLPSKVEGDNESLREFYVKNKDNRDKVASAGNVMLATTLISGAAIVFSRTLLAKELSMDIGWVILWFTAFYFFMVPDFDRAER